MKILIVDGGGVGLDWALRCQDDGHKVKLFIDPTINLGFVGKGLVELVSDYREWMRWADLVFLTDNMKYIAELERWRREGHEGIVAPNQETAAWEQDRQLGQKILQKCKIDVPPFRTFNDYDQAIAYVKREGKRFVSKPSGSADKALSYVSKSPADMVYMLERWKKAGKLKNPFIMQEFIAGTEMGVAGWFGPGGWNIGWEENWEFKKLMNGDLGVATGEQGTVLRVVKKSKLAKLLLEPLTAELERCNYVGCVSVNAIIDDSGKPWPLEFTMRPGWPAFQIIQELHVGDRAEWLLALTQGKDARNWLLDTVAVGVVLSVPDYPYSRITRKEVIGVPIYGVTGQMLEHVHPCEVMLGERVPLDAGSQIVYGPSWVTAGDYVLVMTASGETVTGAKRTVYRRLKKLIVPNSPMYRTDIGDRLARQLPQLQAQGFAMGMEY